jgi:glucose/arabinose dehydrogenase
MIADGSTCNNGARARVLRCFGRASAAAVILLILWASAACRAVAGFVGLERIASDFGGLTVVAQPPGYPNHLVVGNKEGLLRVLDLATGEFHPTAFLNLHQKIDVEGEGGVMGLAFDPNFQETGKFYLSVTVDNGGVQPDPVNFPDVRSPYSMQVREYRVSDDPLVGDPDDFTTLLQWVKPQQDHNGGWLGFSPLHPSNLYILTGDGGGGLDNWPGHTPDIGNAQDLTDNLMGKLLRINVAGDDFPDDPLRNYAIPPDNPFVGVEGDDEIFAYGLRSPWRASFDRGTGDLWIGDVGQDFREEIDLVPADSTGGQNFGWRMREGFVATPFVGGPPPPGNVLPEFDYVHVSEPGNPLLEGNSVLGGYVYRGTDPTLAGKYIFSDFVSNQFWMFDPASPYGTVTNITSTLQPDEGLVYLMTTFCEDAHGNLYVATFAGDVFRLLTDSARPGDFQPDGNVDYLDLAVWTEEFGLVGEPGQFAADATKNGRVAGHDFLVWQRNAGYSSLWATPAQFAGEDAARPVPEPGAGLLMTLAIAGSPFVRRCRASAARPVLGA